MFFTVPGTPPGTEVQDLVANLPSLASDHHPSHTLPSNQERFQFASSCSHTYKTLPLLSSVSKFHASITGCETCPTDSSSSPKRKDQGAAPAQRAAIQPCLSGQPGVYLSIRGALGCWLLPGSLEAAEGWRYICPSGELWAAGCCLGA